MMHDSGYRVQSSGFRIYDSKILYPVSKILNEEYGWTVP